MEESPDIADAFVLIIMLAGSAAFILTLAGMITFVGWVRRKRHKDIINQRKK